MSEEKFKVLIPFESGGNNYYRVVKSYVEDEDFDPSIPRYAGRILDYELRKWVDDRNISYYLENIRGPKDSYLKYQNNWVIVFDNNEDAILFKLTWG